MTVADSFNSRSAGREMRRRAVASGAKPASDVADLLFVNTLESNPKKAPAEASGANDLLDALVQDDLQRAVPEGGGESHEDHAAEVAEALPPGSNLSGDQRNDLLKHEIDMLLAGTPVESAPKEPALSGSGGEGPSETLSQAELDVLLPPETQKNQALEAPLELPTSAAAIVSGDEAEQHLVEAEGVLAEELSQLLAETKQADMPAEEAIQLPKPAAQDAPMPLPAEAAVEEISVDAPANPGQVEAAEMLGPNGETTEPAATIAVESAGPVGAGAQETKSEAASASAPPAGVPEHPVVELADHAEEETETASAGPRRNFASDVVLMVAQLLDIPFAWMEEADKYVLGLVAFLLLLGGIVFQIVAWAIGGQ